MGLNVGNLPVKQVYVGSTPVKAVYVGAEKIWPIGPRVVTITKDHVGEWVQGTVTGDTSLIQRWVGKQNVVFVVDVTCDQGVYSSDDFVVQNPGTVLRAGAEIRPFMRNVYIFTEVL